VNIAGSGEPLAYLLMRFFKVPHNIVAPGALIRAAFHRQLLESGIMAARAQ
jgi:hypothetical protein